ncbi:ABC transporter permease [Aerococcus sp. NPDC058936]|uniref:ABC transporter permease n=1 Tax=Aerococcus sp. NPDC058936 TaxID=3346674 RepID=UPI00366B2043
MHKVSRTIALLPTLILVIVFLLIPLAMLFVTTFVTESGNPIEYYRSFFESSYSLNVLWRTLYIALTVTVICIILGVPTAYFISGLNSRWKNIMMAVTVFPLLTNSVVRSFAWINILGQNGVVNQLLLSSKIIDQSLSLLYTEFAIIIGSVYLFLPTMITSLVGVMDNIDDEIVEAAGSLGLNQLQVFIKVVVPLSVSGMIVGSILVFTGTLTAYTTPQLLGGNRNMVLATYLRQSAMTLGDWQLASVIAVIMVVVTVLVMWLLNKLAARLDRRLYEEEN